MASKKRKAGDEPYTPAQDGATDTEGGVDWRLELVHDIEQYVATAFRLEGENHELRQRLQEKEAATSSSSEETAASEKRELMQRISVLEESLKKAEEDKSNAVKDSQARQMARFEDAKRSYQEEAVALANRRAQDAVAEREQELFSLRDRCELQEREKEELRTKLREALRSKEELEGTVKHYEETTRATQAQIDRTEAELSSLREDVEKVQEAKLHTEKAAQEAKESESAAQARAEDAQRQREEQQREAEATIKELQERNSELSATEKTLRTENEQLKSVAASKDTLETRVSELEKEVEERGAELAAVKQDCEEKDRRLEELTHISAPPAVGVQTEDAIDTDEPKGEADEVSEGVQMDEGGDAESEAVSYDEEEEAPPLPLTFSDVNTQERWVKLKNVSKFDLSMKGVVLQSQKTGQKFEFPAFILPAGSRTTVVWGKEWEKKGSEPDLFEFRWECCKNQREEQITKETDVRDEDKAVGEDDKEAIEEEPGMMETDTGVMEEDTEVRPVVKDHDTLQLVDLDEGVASEYELKPNLVFDSRDPPAMAELST